MKSHLPIVVGVLVALASGWAHGLLIDRWGPPSAIAEVSQQLESTELRFDGWSSISGESLDDHTRKLAGAIGYSSRLYTADDGRLAVQVTVLCGRPGPIALHSPTYCFTLAGMTQLGTETETSVDSAEGHAIDFWMADFRPPESQGGPDVRTFWSWSEDGETWSIPENPRFHYADSPYLYRVYFTAAASMFNERKDPESEDDDGDAVAKENPVYTFMNMYLDRFAELTRSTGEPS